MCSNLDDIGEKTDKAQKLRSIALFHDVEIKRRECFREFHDKFRDKYKELFHRSEAPKDALNRFLLEQLSINQFNSIENIEQAHRSSCLVRPENLIGMDTLLKELTTNYPVTEIKPYFDSIATHKLKVIIDDYLKLAELFLSEMDSKDDQTQNIKKKIEAFSSHYSSFSRNVFENESELKEKFQRLFEECVDYFKHRVKPKIKELLDYTSHILLKNLVVKLDKLAENAKTITCLRDSQSSLRKYPRLEINSHAAIIYYNNIEFRIHRFYLDKLKSLYDQNAVQKYGIRFIEAEFNTRVFTLICRYETFFRNSLALNEGYGMQASLPASTFRLLETLFGVKQEMFASPFNCYPEFKQYCSAFLDTDIYFGSLGSFFNFEPKEGSFECNPPFTEECIERMADRIDYLLSKSDLPMSFIVFIPEWLNPPTPGLVKMDGSPYLKKSLILTKQNHSFISGSQHLAERKSLYYRAVHNTKVFILQNDSGYEKWTPTDEKINRLSSGTELNHHSEDSRRRTRLDDGEQENSSKKSKNGEKFNKKALE